MFRRSNAHSLHKEDIVKIAGNTRSRDEKTVRLVREGVVVATAH